MKQHTILELKARFAELGIAWHRFHIIGERSKADKPNAFDDLLYVVDGESLHCFSCTTNPGTDWLVKLLNPKGAAVVKADAQYPNLWKRGLHKGEPALIQSSLVTVYRDNDLDDKSEEIGVIEKGYFGINLHNANNSFKSILIGKYSAGCQVVPDPKDHEKILSLCDGSGQQYFTYTLLKEF